MKVSMSIETMKNETSAFVNVFAAEKFTTVREIDHYINALRSARAWLKKELSNQEKAS